MGVVVIWIVRVFMYTLLAYAAFQFVGAYHGIRGTNPLDPLRGGTPLPPEELAARRRDGWSRLALAVLLTVVALVVLLLTY